MSSSPKPTPKRLNPADRLTTAEAARMLGLLRDSRLPANEALPGASWECGIPLERLRELREYWLKEWSFEEFVKEISKYEHYTVEIEGVEVHYVHASAGKEGAVPMMMTHGWPGTFYEFHKVIGPLTSPSGDEDPAFDIVLPSLPGFGFSGPAPRKGWTFVDTARVFDTLMVEVLGYEDYVAQGGDWGGAVTRALTANHNDHCTLAHFNNLFEMPPWYHLPVLGAMQVLPKSLGRRVGSMAMTEGEMDDLRRYGGFMMSGLGYYIIQSTMPTTIGYALSDNPLGLLAYIGEKYHGWVDPSHPLSNEDIVSTVALYFLTQSFGTSVLPYYETAQVARTLKLGKQVKGKTGMSVFRWDVLGSPKSWMGRVLNVTFHKRHEQGGHFPGLELPEVLVQDVREFVQGNWQR